MKKNLHQDIEYNSGYYACESEKTFDEAQSDMWKKGYRDKEKERFVRSVKYHLDYISGKIDSCYYLMNNNSKVTEKEYCCYYYGKMGKCKCQDKMLQDFLRLYVNQQ